jgi:PBSX family phage terminase large subunit
VEYRAFDKQREFHLDKSRFRAALAGKRGGKTECGAIETIIHCENKIGYKPSEVDQYIGIILAPTTDMLRRLSLKKFLAYSKPFNPDHHQTYNEIRWHNDTLIYGISGDKPERIEGIKASFIWIDEVFQVSEQLFLECLARVSDTRGRIWVTGSMGVQWTNPKSHWVYKYFKENPSPDYKCFEWATADNPHFPREELDLLKDTLDPRTYRQMFTIDWNVPGTAMVYDELDDGNVCIHEYNPNLETYVSIDWGWAHDMAALFFQYDRAKDIVYLFDEIVLSKMTIDKLWDRIQSKNYRIKEWICDIAGTQEREQTGRSNVNWFRDEHKINFKYRSSAVQYGISIVRSYIKNTKAQRRLLIDSKRCPKTWDQLCNYRYPEKNGVIQNENPVKINDDACDALRYFFVNVLDSSVKNTFNEFSRWKI